MWKGNYFDQTKFISLNISYRILVNNNFYCSKFLHGLMFFKELNNITGQKEFKEEKENISVIQ